MHALNNLILFYNNSSPGDVYYSVAEILLDNINSLFDQTIYDWAQLCFVSTATISRFCQKLGYKNFNEFKIELSNSVENYHILNQYAPINQLGQYESEENAYLTILKNTVDNFCRTADLNKIEELADVIHRHSPIRIYTHGVSLNEASLQSNLIMSGLQVKAIDMASIQLKDISSLPPSALAILTLPNVHERTLHLDILKALKSKDVTIVLLTNSKHSIYLNYADYSYCFDGIMTQLDDYQFNMIFSLLSITYRRKYVPIPNPF